MQKEIKNMNGFFYVRSDSKIFSGDWQLLSLRYKTDLDPVFHLFPNLKKYVDAKRFGLNEEVIAAVYESESYFRTGLKED